MLRPVQALPKAHLHLHFTGSMRLRTLLALAEKHSMRLPEALTTGWPPKLRATDERGWFRFQRLYDMARACVRDEEDMRRIVREAAQDDAAEGSRWLEIQVDPTSYAPFVGGITPALEIVLDEARVASAATGTGVAVVVAASRMRHPLDARTLARLAVRYAGEGPGTVVGFGLSNDERRGRTGDFAHAFDIARRAGLACVPHGGELLGADAVAETLDRAAAGPARPRRPQRRGPRGAGGGRAPGRDPGGLPRQQRRPGGLPRPDGGAPAPAAARPGPRWPSAPTTRCCSGRGWPAQYESARTALGLGDDELAALARGSVRGSRAPEALRKTLLDDIDAWLAAPASA